MSIQSNLNNMLLVGAGGAGAYFTKGAGRSLAESNIAKKDLKRMGIDPNTFDVAEEGKFNQTLNQLEAIQKRGTTPEEQRASYDVLQSTMKKPQEALQKIYAYDPRQETLEQMVGLKAQEYKVGKELKTQEKAEEKAIDRATEPKVAQADVAAVPTEEKKAEAAPAEPETGAPEVLAYAKAANQGPDEFDRNRDVYTNTPYDVDDPWDIAAEQALKDSVKNSTEQQKAMEMRAQILGKQMEDWGRANIGTTWDRGIQDYKNYGQLLGQWDKAFKTARREGGKV